jgi:hypothetical protein
VRKSERWLLQLREKEPSLMEKNSKVIEALDTLQDVEASLDELLHKAATLLDAHDVALARPVDPVDLIQYARELSATTRARPGWDGRAHVMPQRYFAPTYEMVLNPNAWLQVAAHAPPPPPPPAGAHAPPDRAATASAQPLQQ